MARAEAGNASLRAALLAAVERSGKLDALIVRAPRRSRKRGAPSEPRRHDRRKAAAQARHPQSQGQD